MKRVVANVLVKIVDRSIRNETDSVCAFFGYQPFMPSSVDKFRKKRK